MSQNAASSLQRLCVEAERALVARMYRRCSRIARRALLHARSMADHQENKRENARMQRRRIEKEDDNDNDNEDDGSGVVRPTPALSPLLARVLMALVRADHERQDPERFGLGTIVDRLDLIQTEIVFHTRYRTFNKGTVEDRISANKYALWPVAVFLCHFNLSMVEAVQSQHAAALLHVEQAGMAFLAYTQAQHDKTPMEKGNAEEAIEAAVHVAEQLVVHVLPRLGKAADVAQLVACVSHLAPPQVQRLTEAAASARLQMEEWRREEAKEEEKSRLMGGENECTDGAVANAGRTNDKGRHAPRDDVPSTPSHDGKPEARVLQMKRAALRLVHAIWKQLQRRREIAQIGLVASVCALVILWWTSTKRRLPQRHAPTGWSWWKTWRLLLGVNAEGAMIA